MPAPTAPTGIPASTPITTATAKDPPGSPPHNPHTLMEKPHLKHMPPFPKLSAPSSRELSITPQNPPPFTPAAPIPPHFPPQLYITPKARSESYERNLGSHRISESELSSTNATAGEEDFPPLVPEKDEDEFQQEIVVHTKREMEKGLPGHVQEGDRWAVFMLPRVDIVYDLPGLMGGLEGSIEGPIKDPYGVYRGAWGKTKKKFERSVQWTGWDQVLYDLEAKEGFVPALRAKVVFDLVEQK